MKLEEKIALLRKQNGWSTDYLLKDEGEEKMNIKRTVKAVRFSYPKRAGIFKKIRLCRTSAIR